MSSHAFALLLVGVLWLTVAIAIGIDAVRRGRYGGVWALTVFLLGPVGILIYVLAVLTASTADTGRTDTESLRLCPACGATHPGAPEQCSECGEPLGPDDEPQAAQLVRSGSRGYCTNCNARVDLDADLCPDCGAQF